MNLIQGVGLVTVLSSVVGCCASIATPPDDSPAFTADLHCGQLPLHVEGQGEHLTLRVLSKPMVLQQVISASGARYKAVADDEDKPTELWFKGDQASLILQGVPYPQCAPANALIEPFRASGNEPFWSLTMERGNVALTRLDQVVVSAPDYIAGEQPGEYVSSSQPPLRVQIRDGVCRDDMTGMPYPQKVAVELDDGTRLEGCGGEPMRFLQGGEWVVEDINEGGIIDRSRVSLTFWPEGRVTGMASCNALTGQYELTGEGLHMEQIATTRKACAPSLMQQEQRVLSVLNQLQRFDVDDTGALLLYSEGGSLKARLETW